MPFRDVAFAVLALLLACTSFADETRAFSLLNEVCLDEVVVRGKVTRGEHAARKSAIAAWRPVAARRYGRAFADYYNSGEREFSCTWNDSGSHYRCTVSARPCGPKSAEKK